MAIIGNARESWAQESRYVLAWEDEEKVIGPVVVAGLDAVLAAMENARLGKRTSVPDLDVIGLDSESKRWLFEWAATWGQQRNLVIRDQSEDRWFYVRRAFIRRMSSTSSAHPVVINRVELGDEPSWW